LRTIALFTTLTTRTSQTSGTRNSTRRIVAENRFEIYANRNNRNNRNNNSKHRGNPSYTTIFLRDKKDRFVLDQNIDISKEIALEIFLDSKTKPSNLSLETN
jgi:hypothetical protein